MTPIMPLRSPHLHVFAMGLGAAAVVLHAFPKLKIPPSLPASLAVLCLATEFWKSRQVEPENSECRALEKEYAKRFLLTLLEAYKKTVKNKEAIFPIDLFTNYVKNKELTDQDIALYGNMIEQLYQRLDPENRSPASTPQRKVSFLVERVQRSAQRLQLRSPAPSAPATPPRRLVPHTPTKAY